MTTQDEISITLVLDSDDPGVGDSTALAVERLGGRVTGSVGGTIEVVVPVKVLLNEGAQANQQTFLAALAQFQHVKDVRRTPTMHPAAGTR